MSSIDKLLEKKIQTDKDECIETIESALKTLWESHKDDKDYIENKRKKYLPSPFYLMQVIKEYYNEDTLLNEFSTDDMFQNIKYRDSWELDSYVGDKLDEQERDLRAEFEEELDAIDTDVCHKIEDMTPDEWWETVARIWGICSPMDTERMKHGISKMLDKLNRSNYQTAWRRIAGAFFKKCKDYGSTEEVNTNEQEEKEIV